MDIKKYYIPEELNELFIDFTNYEDLKQIYCKLPFGFKKAIKCGKEEQRFRNLFWRKVMELHPELVGKKLTYQAHQGFVEEKLLA